MSKTFGILSSYSEASHDDVSEDDAIQLASSQLEKSWKKHEDEQQKNPSSPRIGKLYATPFDRPSEFYQL